ncbi:MAG: XRE family transcriptional regulator [Polyangiaceae bacterium]
MSTSIKIGKQTKAMRESRGVSVTDLAERSGCSVELIEAVEEGRMAPSISPLARIARALGVRLGTLVDGAEHPGPAIDRARDRHVVARFADCRNSSENGTNEYCGLATAKSDRHFDPFLLTLQPDAVHRLSSHEGEEFLFVLSGKVEVEYGKERHILDASDSIYFDSVVPHSVSAVGDEPARVLTVIYCPT